MLERLSDSNILQIQRDAIRRAKGADETSVPGSVLATDDVLNYITSLSMGDARTALNLLELVLKAPAETSPDIVFATLKNTTMARFVTVSFIIVASDEF